MVIIDKRKIIDELIRTGCLKLGKFKLKSGVETDHYVNLREVGEHPELFRMIVKSVENMLPNAENLKIVGVPYGAVGLAGAVAFSSGVPFHFVRKEPKDYGFKSDENSKDDDHKYVVLEDVMTTGSSIAETIDKMPGKVVTDVIVVVNRHQNSRESELQKLYPEIRIHSLLHISEILETSKLNQD